MELLSTLAYIKPMKLSVSNGVPDLFCNGFLCLVSLDVHHLLLVVVNHLAATRVDKFREA